MVRNGGIYVNSIDLGIFEQFFVIGKSFGNPVLIGNFIKAILIPPTNSYDLRIWVALVNGNELAPKPRPIMATLGFSIFIIHLFEG